MIPEWVAQGLIVVVAALLLVCRRRHCEHLCVSCRWRKVNGMDEPCRSCSCTYPDLCKWEPLTGADDE